MPPLTSTQHKSCGDTSKIMCYVAALTMGGMAALSIYNRSIGDYDTSYGFLIMFILCGFALLVFLQSISYHYIIGFLKRSQS